MPNLSERLRKDKVPDKEIEVTRKVIISIYNYTNIGGRPQERGVRELIIYQDVRYKNEFSVDDVIKGIDNAEQKEYVRKDANGLFVFTQKTLDIIK